MKHKLPTETINKVLNYLASQPYSQVSELIKEIQITAVMVTPSEEEESKQEETADL